MVLLLALPALAHAGPPDPVWIPGMYDGGDHDDVVALVTSSSGHAPPTSPADSALALESAGAACQTADRLTAEPSIAPCRSRAPPAA